MHFWQVVTRFLGGISCPVKYGFKGAIPELIKSRLLSLCGTREKLFMARWPLLSKNSRNIRRSSFTPRYCGSFTLSSSISSHHKLHNRHFTILVYNYQDSLHKISGKTKDFPLVFPLIRDFIHSLSRTAHGKPVRLPTARIGRPRFPLPPGPAGRWPVHICLPVHMPCPL